MSSSAPSQPPSYNERREDDLPTYDEATRTSNQPGQVSLAQHLQPGQQQRAEVSIDDGEPFEFISLSELGESAASTIRQNDLPRGQGTPNPAINNIGPLPSNSGGNLPAPVQPVVYETVIVSQFQPTGRDPYLVMCPQCHEESQTKVRYRPNLKTHLCAALLCVLGYWCCIFPYCFKSCMSANHYCRNCNQFLGTYSDFC